MTDHRTKELNIAVYREIVATRPLSQKEAHRLLDEIEYLRLEWRTSCPESFDNIGEWEKAMRELAQLKRRRGRRG